MSEVKGKLIEFKRNKAIHFTGYTEEEYFNYFKDKNRFDYNMDDVVKSLGIELKEDQDTFNEFPESKDTVFAIIEVDEKNNVRICLNPDDNKMIYKYDTLNASLSIISNMILTNLERYNNKYVIIDKQAVASRSFFKEYYLNPHESIHTDFAFQMTKPIITRKIERTVLASGLFLAGFLTCLFLHK